MEFRVEGRTTPVVAVTLAAGEQIGSAAGELGSLRGEGLFLTELVGRGKVWLQSITLAGLAQALSPYLVTNRDVAEVGAAGVGAALLGGLLKK